MNSIIPILLTAMFFFSGCNKINNFQKTVLNFKDKMNIDLNENVYKFIIAIVILLEIGAPVVIGYSAVTGKWKEFSIYAIYCLIAFTILATIIYHPLDVNNYYKSIPFWSNLSLVCGLLLLVMFVKKCKI